MPRQYEAIRDKLAKGATSGPAYDSAQSSAAAIYNSKHPEAPVTGKSDSSRPKKRRKPRKKTPAKSDFDYMGQRKTYG